MPGVGSRVRGLALVTAAFAAQAFLTRHGPLPRTRHSASLKAGDVQCSGEPAIDRSTFLKSASAFVLSSCLVTKAPSQALAIGELPEFSADDRFAQHLVVKVPNMEEAVRFYTVGLNMKILRTRLVNGANQTFVGYGPETLSKRPDFFPGVSSFELDGGHFSLELSEVKANKQGDIPVLDQGNGVAYLQLGIPDVRVSNIIKSGGKIVFAYGWILAESPGGLLHQIIIGLRRDPFMFLALNVKDIKKSAAFYKTTLGMKENEFPLSRAKDSAYEPKQPKDSVYLSYNPEGFGVLLLPYKPKGRGGINVGGIVDKLAIAAKNVVSTGESIQAKFAGEVPGIGTRVAVTTDPDGYGVVLVEYEDLETELL